MAEVLASNGCCSGALSCSVHQHAWLDVALVSWEVELALAAALDVLGAALDGALACHSVTMLYAFTADALCQLVAVWLLAAVAPT